MGYSSTRLASYPVTYHRLDDKHYVFDIALSDEEHVVLSTFKDLVNVKLVNATRAHFGTSVGLMGDYANGRMLARDGITVLSDPNEFGQEWQVHPARDPMLFQNKDGGPQYPEKCILPNPAEKASRRLGEGSIPHEAAEEACSKHWSDKERQDLCVYDVLAMQDLEVAQAGVY